MRCSRSPIANDSGNVSYKTGQIIVCEFCVIFSIYVFMHKKVFFRVLDVFLGSSLKRPVYTRTKYPNVVVTVVVVSLLSCSLIPMIGITHIFAGVFFNDLFPTRQSVSVFISKFNAIKRYMLLLFQ